MPARAKAQPQLSFIFRPDGFVCDVAADERGKPTLAAESRPWLPRFRKDRARALFDLGFTQPEGWLTPSMRYLRRVSAAFVRDVFGQADIELTRERASCELADATARELLLALPFSPGAEHVDAGWLAHRFAELGNVMRAELGGWDGTVEHYVTTRTQDLHVPGRIFFHLVENSRDADEGFPFAFVATYAKRDGDSVRHFPLRYALEDFEGDQRRLLGLLADLTRAAEASDLVAHLMESGELFHPLRLTQQEAYELLTSVGALEDAGVLCRVPNWWRRGSASPVVSIRVGDERPASLGAGALIALTPSLTVDGEPLTQDEIAELLRQTEGLALIKGRWVEVDHERIGRLLAAMEDARTRGLTLFEAIRETSATPDEDALVQTSRGTWLDQLISRMRAPIADDAPPAPQGLAATLRPYQQVGYSWLTYLHDLGLGACLADDMGLGKTVQLIAHLEHLREQADDAGVRALLVVPASLVGNWAHELDRFAPTLDYQVLHGKGAAAIDKRWADVADDELRRALPTLSITTYAMAQRLDVLTRINWDVLVLDEAQAIKNPAVKQTKALKALNSATRIALTGTPVENDLSNLWSVFDFLNPGMLGTLKEFKTHVRTLEESPGGYAPLRQTIAPFLLRRLKTDKAIISDLPDKVEIDQYVQLSRRQVALYRKVVSELEQALGGDELSAIKRQGLVLATITKLKQVCNHPDQYLGQTGFATADSGKFQLLCELAQTIYEKRERVLVFTQFREMCDPLARLLEGVFKRPGLVIHGGVGAARRTRLVQRFQGDEYVPFMVLSLKAGGVGLNLTAASNVIHFDRWWNPAVENQATDRAFRIGQTRDVMVHKLVCEQTLEERISQIIADKSRLASEVVGEGESWLGRLDDARLSQLLRFGTEG